VNIVSEAWKLSTIQEQRQDKFLFRLEDYRNSVHNPENLSRVRVSVKMVYLGSKLGAIEEQHQDESFSFQ
jgi:hypothetical protein